MEKLSEGKWDRLDLASILDSTLRSVDFFIKPMGQVGSCLNFGLSEVSVKGKKTILTFADGKKITILTTNVSREDN
tara:strand:+ start:45 stop:272 length:228 start_codon:yes stop_codon:yes gene_type:complete